MAKTGKLLLAALLLWGGVAVGAEPDIRVEGTLDRRQIGVGQEFMYTVSVISNESVNAEDPTIPDLDGIRVTNTGTSSSTSSNMRAGPSGWKIETTQRTDYSFMMIALRAGSLTIPPFSLRVNGKLFQTKPVVMTVANQAVPPSSPPPGGGSPFGQGQMPSPEDLLDDPDALFRALLNRRLQAPPAHNDLPTNPNEVLFIQTEVDKKEVYEGEQVTANWYILVRGNLLSLDRTKFPDLKGFWKEIIEEVPALQFSQEVINGQVYRRALLASHALFPIKAGTSIIDEYRIKGRVQVPTSAFGFGKDYAFTKASDRVPITVKPLPTEGRPPDFTGAVGLFNVNAQFDNNIVTLNQPMTLKIRFEGTGNAKLIEMPQVDWPASLEMVEVKSESRFFKNGQSFKEFEFILIPRQAGDLAVPPISVSLFNPETHQYYTRTLENVVLKVIDNGSGKNALPSARISDKKPEAPKELTLPPPMIESQAGAGLFANVGVRMALLFALYAFSFIALGVRAFQVFTGREQKKDLTKLLARRMKKAEASAGAGDYRAAGVEMINLFAEILGDISGQGGSHKEVEKMLELGPPSLRRQHGDQILQQLSHFQTLAFAPEDLLRTAKNPPELTKKVRESRTLLAAIIASR
ncbi:MAG: protein BatD [Bdellovibrionaceae bacterium]|nr:protein BatD [Pseudobdellovibrionaceae bacterium]